MPKISDKDIRFLYNAIIIALVIMAIMLAFKPYVQTMNDPRLMEVQYTDKQIVRLSPPDVVGMLKSTNGKPTMLMVYASWCPYCVKTMPEVMKIKQAHKLDGYNTIFLSVDEEPRDLSTYLVHNDFHTAFKPYLLDRSIFKKLNAELAKTGSQYKGSIPYIGFFNPDGTMKFEFTSSVNEAILIQALEKHGK